MNLIYISDAEYQDCLVWEHNREFYIFSHKKNEELLEDFCLLIYSSTYEIKIENIPMKKSKEFIMILGEVKNMDEFLENHYKDLYVNNIKEEEKSSLAQEESNIENKDLSKKKFSFKNFQINYPEAKIVYKAGVNIQ